ncbi:rho GTPase-activating protein 21-like [Symsagittifera roscoffensis]|uniref:rho GTPase-activating protein 21-like n=1 Tax=Symsagittifera roscoffensis TaxID=84072 RepID=UPI00307CB689
MNGSVRSQYGKRSTSPRPLPKAIPLPTVPSIKQTPNYHTSSDNLNRSQSSNEEPIYDVPPCFDNNWDSSQTLPRHSMMHMDSAEGMHSRTSTMSSLSTINSCTSVATLTNQAREPSFIQQLSVQLYDRSPGGGGPSRAFDDENIVSHWYPESPNEYSKTEPRTGSLGDKRKRSKSKNRSLLQRSGSVLKSMFSSSNDEVSGTKTSHKKGSDLALTIDVNSQPSCNMQGRLLLKEIRNCKFDDLSTESLRDFEMMPWQSVTIFTSHSQLHMQKSHSAPQSDDGVSLDLVGCRCEPILCHSSSLSKKSRDHKTRNISSSVTCFAFKLQLQTEHAVVRVFQTDSKDSMVQWINCLQNISQLTPVSFQSVSQAPPSPIHGSSFAHLESYQMSPSNPYVPIIVTECCEQIEHLGGLHLTGIYRVPGNSIHINSLLGQINPSLSHLDLSNADVHTTASALKTFLRRLPEPLITNDWYSSLIVANRKRDDSERLEQIKMVINQLPIHNFETLKYLMRHLDKIAQHSEENKMDVTNLATVFGPTLLRSPASPEVLLGPSSKGAIAAQKEDMISIWGDMLEQRSIIEAIISNHRSIFASDDSRISADSRSGSSHLLPDVVKDTGFRRDSNVSLNSLTSAAQMHLNCTASAVRKMSVEKLSALATGSRKGTSSKLGPPSSRNSPLPTKAEFIAISREVSPVPRRSKSMSDKADKLNNKIKQHHDDNSASEKSENGSSFTETESPAMQQAAVSSASSISLNGSGEGNYFQSQKMLKDLDSLIESLKAECKEKDDKVRRSAEEGQEMFDNFCKLFTNDSKSPSRARKKQEITAVPEVRNSPSKDSQASSSFSGSGDLEHLIARELDAKIANLRLEYTIKVDKFPISDSDPKDSFVCETAVTDKTSLPEKASVTNFIKNPSYDVERKQELKTGEKLGKLSSEAAVKRSESIKLDTDKISRSIEASLKMRSAEFGDRQPSVYENVEDSSPTSDEQKFQTPYRNSNREQSQNPMLTNTNLYRNEAKTTSNKPVPNMNQSHSIDTSYSLLQTSPKMSPRHAQAAKQFQSNATSLSVDTQMQSTSSSRRSPFKSPKSDPSSSLLKNVMAPLRPLSKSRNKQNTVPNDTADTDDKTGGKVGDPPFPLSPNSTLSSNKTDRRTQKTVNERGALGGGAHLSAATPSRSNRGSLNPAHLVQTSVESSVNLSTKNISSSSSSNIDRSASRSWVTRSNPDLLTAVANKSANRRSGGGGGTPSTPAKVIGGGANSSSSSSSGTPNPKQLMVFHTSQV